MTVEEFEERLTAVGEKYLGVPSTTHTEISFRMEIQNLVHEFYACGGCLLDRCERPIRDVEDVEVIVTRGPHTMSVSTVRKNFNPFMEQS